MDQFNKLPLQQKIAAVLAGMVVFAGLIWYAMISPIEDEMAGSQGQKSQLIEQIDTLNTKMRTPNKQKPHLELGLNQRIQKQQ